MLRLYDRLIDGLALIAVVLIFAIMIGVGADVGARFLFGRPIGWMLEFTEHGLLCILACGMAWLVRQRGHVAIELAVHAAPPRLARAMQILAVLAAAATSGILAVWAVKGAVSDYRTGVETFGLHPMPRFLLFSVIALGFFLTALEFLRWCWRLIAGTEPPPGRSQDESALL